MSEATVQKKNNRLLEFWKDKEQRGKLVRSLIPFVGLVFIILFFQISTGGRLLTSNNLRTVLNQTFSIILGACGMVFVISQGNLDFSMGSVSGFAAVVGAMSSGAGPLVSLLVALAVGAAIGALNGLLHVGLRAPANIVTLCTQFAFRGVVQVVAAAGLIIPMTWAWLDSTPVKIVVAVILVLLTVVVFSYTKFGKYCKAIGSGGIASVQSGVPLDKMKVLAFMLSGTAAGLSGFFSMIRAGSVAPTTGTGLEMNVLLAIVLGGMPLSGGANSKVRAVILGSAMLAFLMNGLVIWGLNDLVQQGVKGAIFLIAVGLSFERGNIAVIK